MNIFPLYSYEQFSDFDKEINEIKENCKDKENSYIEIYNQTRGKLAILDLGISPVQLFKSAHPERPKLNNNNSMIDLNSSIKNSSKNLRSILNLSNNSYTDESGQKKKIDKKLEKKNKEKKINELFIPIKQFISLNKSQKYKIELNNKTMSLFFIFKKKIIIYNILNNTKKFVANNEPQIFKKYML